MSTPGLIATVSAGGTAYHLTDGLGSTANLCDETGAVHVSYTYDAFGAVRTQSAPSDNDFLFAGEQRDAESGLDYLRAQYYDPATGRFLGRDPASPDYGSPGTLNPYNYVLSNPVNWVDPFGLQLIVVCDVKDANGMCLAAHYKGTEAEVAAEAALLESQGYLTPTNKALLEGAETIEGPEEDCGFLGVDCAVEDVSDFLGDPCNSAAVSATTMVLTVVPFGDVASIPINAVSTAAAWDNGDYVGAGLGAVATTGSVVSLALDATVVGIPARAAVGVVSGVPVLIYSTANCVF